MADERQDRLRTSTGLSLLHVPLFRLLAINLAAGVVLAALLVGGLLLLNPFNLRHLIFADSSPGTALGMLLFGFIVTFGSAAMGSAIMSMGELEDDDEGRRDPLLPVAVIAPQSRDKDNLRSFRPWRAGH